MSSLSGVPQLQRPSLSGLTSIRADTFTLGNVNISANSISGIDTVNFNNFTVSTSAIFNCNTAIYGNLIVSKSIINPDLSNTNTTIFNQLNNLSNANVNVNNQIVALQNGNLNVFSLVSNLSLGNLSAHQQIIALQNGNTRSNIRLSTLETKTQLISSNALVSILTGNLLIQGTANITGSQFITDKLDIGYGNIPSTITYTIGDSVTVNTSIKKFGNGSLSFNTNSNSQLIIRGITSTNFSTLFTQMSSAFTIEFWMYALTSTVTPQCLFSAYDEGFFDFSFYNNGTTITFLWKMGTTLSGNLAFNNSVPGGFNLNTWTHITIRFDNSLATNKYRLTIGGTSISLGGNSAGVVPLATIFNSTFGFCIASRYNNGSLDNRFNGYIDNFRISADNKYVNSGFTPPTTEFTSDSNTVLLNRFEHTFLYNSQITPSLTSVAGVNLEQGRLTAHNGIISRYSNIEAQASDSCVKINGNNVLSLSTLGNTVVNSNLSTVGTLTSLNVSGYALFKNYFIRLSRTTQVTCNQDQTLMAGMTVVHNNGLTYDTSLGIVTVPFTAYWRVSFFCRFNDTNANRGVKPTIYFVQWILSGDNTYWCPSDGTTNRRCVQWGETLRLVSGQSYSMYTPNTALVNEVLFCMELAGM